MKNWVIRVLVIIAGLLLGAVLRILFHYPY
ncbi:hypothetical protein HNP81_003863 [Peribacillus huizhouensis]|uniref:Uncharacterized protein n=1 Tax=Peribacillus huizhouensis TaxID=1501239 RepID=A0ABR6CV48_9BACI|nr:hypothetical protein [Peribacillus huizhouensis]